MINTNMGRDEDDRQPVDTGSRRELFVDSYLIGEIRDGADLRLHSPTPRETALKMEYPCERGGYITVFKDQDRYRMYYQGLPQRQIEGENLPWFGHDELLVCYAESRDGIHWERPRLGLFEFKGTKDNNIVWAGRGSHGFAPFIDTRPGCPDELKYKAFGRSRIRDKEEGSLWRSLFLMTSPDGLHWTPVEGPKKFGAILDRDDGNFDSQNVGFWDETIGAYRLYFRSRRIVENNEELLGRDDGEGGVSRKPELRDTATAVSPDLMEWSDLRLLEYPGAPLEEMYTNQVIPYPRAPHIYMGFPARYMENRGPLTEWHQKKMEETPGRYFASYTDGLFMSSRDGKVFKRWNEAFLRPGIPEESRWCYGECYQNWGIVETASDIPGAPNEFSFYVTEGRRHGEEPLIRRFTLRQDGFVSVNAPLSGGELLTRPLVFSGKRLSLNMSTSAAGGVRVELQDGHGKALPGFELEKSPCFFGNTLERNISWKSGADLGNVAGKPVQIRFVLNDADIYSFRFTP